ncbi:MAG: hypothetical protein K2X76_16025 [Sphingomonas sp.]|nr:hypothetical protein [Sphingomonas sp.]OQW48247.1 MAG: hypothetical protein A4S16_00850 [Proteobacteria bacterium SG_bin6]
MADLDRIADLLEELIDEIRGLRREFNEFTGYNTMKMSEAVEALTGRTGYNMQDIHEKLCEAVAGIGSLETTIDLK